VIDLAGKSAVYVVSIISIMVAALIIHVISYVYQESREVQMDQATKEVQPI
jgi:hypothetical protein